MPSADALRIHADLPVVDGHNDLPWKLRVEGNGDLDALDPSGPLPSFHTDIGRMLEGGVGAQFWSVYVPVSDKTPFATTLEQIDLVERMVVRDERLQRADTATEARAARGDSRIASLLGAEGGHSIESDLGKLRALADRGVRYMTLTHSDTTSWAGSATDTARHGGLTDFGRDVVREMNRLGVLVDLSHVSVDTMRDALGTSKAPVIASHSNAFARAPHARNVPDDVLRAIGDRGGVVMAVFFPGFVLPETAAGFSDLFALWRKVRARIPDDEAAVSAEIERAERAMNLAQGSVADVVDHIEHIASVAGVDAVGLGSDFDGMTMTPEGLEDVSCYPAITDELLVRGWSEGDIRKVLGENSLRVLESAEHVAG